MDTGNRVDNMYRFYTIIEYDNRLIQLTDEIQSLKTHNIDPQRIVEYEQLKLSYTIERNEFIEEYSQIPKRLAVIKFSRY